MNPVAMPVDGRGGGVPPPRSYATAALWTVTAFAAEIT